jgi:hypothetical protein
VPHHVTSVNYCLDELVATITELSLHTATPDASGSNEVTGGGYARLVSPVFDPAAAGVAALADPYEFTLTDETVAAVGYWRGSQFGGYGLLPAEREIVGTDTLTVQAFRLRLDGVALLG